LRLETWQQPAKRSPKNTSGSRRVTSGWREGGERQSGTRVCVWGLRRSGTGREDGEVMEMDRRVPPEPDQVQEPKIAWDVSGQGSWFSANGWLNCNCTCAIGCRTGPPRSWDRFDAIWATWCRPTMLLF